MLSQYIFIFVLFLFELGNCHLLNYSIFDNLNKQEVEYSIPYQAQVIQPGDNSYFCGAAIISRTHVLTAASCIKYEPTLYQILVGSTTFKKGHVYAVEKVKIHPNFRPGSFANDVALLKLKYPLKFDNTVQKIRLPTEETTFENRHIYHGFGVPHPNDHSSFKSFEITAVACRNKLFDKICAVCRENKCNSCQAHSGEVLVSRGELIGIVSRPSTCFHPNMPISFTRVFSFLDFIYRESASFHDAKKKKDKKKNDKKKKDKKEKVTNDPTWPFYIGISKKDKKLKIICGGALISKKHFVTADQCMDDKSKYVAVIGSAKRDAGKPNEIIKMKSFKKKRSVLAEAMKLAWLALKLLNRSPKLVLQPLKLPKAKENIKEGAEATIIGYGLQGEPNLDLIYWKVPFYTNKCNKLGLKSAVCVQDQKRSGGSCKIDPGSPMVIGDKLVGIVPYAKKCDKKMKGITIIDPRLYYNDIMKATKNLKD